MSAKDLTVTDYLEDRAHPHVLEDERKNDVLDATADVRLIDSSGKIRLIPTPSADPNDPLRTPLWRKWAVVVALCLYTAGGMTVANSIAAIIPALTMYYDEGPPPAPSSETISQLGTFPSLFMGIGAILSVLAAQWVGTRPVMIFDSALTVSCTVWAAVSHGASRGLYSHIAARVFAGLGAGGAESLVPLILQDMNYIHTRNTKFAIIWSVGGVVSSALGSSSTYIVNNIGWRSFYWVLAAISFFALVLIILIVPETSFPRTTNDLLGNSPVDEDGFAEPVKPIRRNKSYMYSLRLYSEHTSARQAWLALKDLARCSLFPNIVWAVFLNASLSGSTISASLVEGNVLIGAYHWAPENVGLLSVPLAVASLFVIPLAGIFSDWVIKLLARRNGGKHMPESQIINMILPVIVSFIGTLCYGIFCAHPKHYHWILPLLMTGFQFYGLMSINILTATYAIECFPDLAGPMMIMVGAYRNIVGFGITYGAQKFVNNVGFEKCFGTFASLIALFGLCGIYFYIKGRALRESMDTWSIRHSRAAHLHTA